MYEDRPLVAPDIHLYEKSLSNYTDSKHIVMGESALMRNGLTSLLSSVVQLSTLYTGITGIFSDKVMWYFNPFETDIEYTTPSSYNELLLVPTEERALVEYMYFHDYFNEGILIEGLKNYLWRHKDDISALYPAADHFKLPREKVDYWVKEAYEDFED